MSRDLGTDSFFACGIPEVELQGTMEDWLDIRRKIDRLLVLGEKTTLPQLVKWHAILVPVIDEMVESYKGNVDPKFWQQCKSWIARESNNPYVSGWAAAFAPFYLDGRWMLKDPENILTTRDYGSIRPFFFANCAASEVTISMRDGSEALLRVGALVSNYDTETDTISPSFDAMLHKAVPGLADAIVPSALSEELAHMDKCPMM